jgi:hypothetical protein
MMKTEKLSGIPVYTLQTNIDTALAEVRAAWSHIEPRLIIYFASPALDLEALAKGLQRDFPGAQQIGCTSSGEIAGGKMLKHSLVAIALPPAVVRDVHVELVRDVGDPAGLERALAGFAGHFGRSLATLAHDKYVGLILIDGLSRAEEQLMDWLGNHTDVMFVGGSAGDDLRFERTRVAANGNVASNAAVLAVLEPSCPFELIKTQSCRQLPTRLVATKVDEASRRVLEFNGQPAAREYAAAVKVPVEQIAERFMRNPLGLMVGNEPYVRSPQRSDGSALTFYCKIKEGMELSLLESSDIIGDTRQALAAAGVAPGKIAALINFNCILRTLELEAEHETEAYGNLFANLPAIGFSTYGEAYLGHMNQTATMLVLRHAAASPPR